MKKMEFLICWSDHTWTTEIWDVPPDVLEGPVDVEDWATAEADRRGLKEAVYIGLYCVDPLGVDA